MRNLVVEIQLHSSLVDVDVRIAEIQGRHVASADTPNGPSLGVGLTMYDALVMALEPFDGAIVELLADMWSENAEEEWDGPE